MAEHVACMREVRGAYRVSLGKLEGKKPLGRPETFARRLLELILKKQSVGVYWIDLAEETENWRSLLMDLSTSIQHGKFPD